MPADSKRRCRCGYRKIKRDLGSTPGSPGSWRRNAIVCQPAICHPKAAMRDPQTIETELMEISSIADDLVKFERIVAWCASHPDEVPFALHQLMRQKEKEPNQMTEP